MEDHELLNWRRMSHGDTKTTNCNQKNLAFIAAVKAGQLNTVRLLLKRSLGTSSLEKKTALHYASKLGSVDIVHELVEFGAGIDCKDKDGYTPLMKASRNGHASVVDYLCSKGAKVNDTVDAHNGDAPLHLAAEKGHLDACKMLLKHGALTSLKTKKDQATALYRSANRGHDVVCCLLLENMSKDDIFAKTSDKERTCLHAAAAAGHAKVCRVLVNTGEFALDDKDGEGSMAQHLAARTQQADSAELITPLTNKEVMQAMDANGRTTLHLACENGNLQIAKYLVEHGANVDLANSYGTTCLHAAATNGHLEIVQLLLENRARIGLKDLRKTTPLMKAAAQGHLEIVQVLLDYDPAQVSTVDYCHAQSLHWAAGSGHTEVCEELLKRGADVNAMDFKGQTPFLWAAHHNHIATCRVLIIHGAEDPLKLSKSQSLARGPLCKELITTKQPKKQIPHEHQSSTNIIAPVEKPSLFRRLLPPLKRK